MYVVVCYFCYYLCRFLGILFLTEIRFFNAKSSKNKNKNKNICGYQTESMKNLHGVSELWYNHKKQLQEGICVVSLPQSSSVSPAPS